MKTLSELKHDVIDVLRSSAEDVRAIYIFGSFAAGTASKKSDLDIGIRCRASVPLETIFKMSALLEIKLALEVDLLDMMVVSTVMQMQIVSTGVRIYCANEFETENDDDCVFSSYARLNEERAGILESIKARGSVYG